MSVFCSQCKETTNRHVCTGHGKSRETSQLEDLLIYIVQGISVYHQLAKESDVRRAGTGRFVSDALYATVPDVHVDAKKISSLVKEALFIRDELKEVVARHRGNRNRSDVEEARQDSTIWNGGEALFAGVAASEEEDVRSLRELLIYGLKGIAAYARHAAVLGRDCEDVYEFLMSSLALTTKHSTVDELFGLVLKAGEIAVATMAILDSAHTDAYGTPESTEVSTRVQDNPGILVSGHNLEDLEELLEQTKGTGVDVYTHGGMLAAHYYPTFKKHAHFVGNYGGGWYDQKREFESFNGPILMTTNCLVPVHDSYQDRIYATGVVGFAGVKRIPDRRTGERKDFSAIIAQAKTCPPPLALETGESGDEFAPLQVLSYTEEIVEAVNAGAIKRFLVMAGCDGRRENQQPLTDVVEGLPDDALILAAGCTRYRFNKLDLGDVNGIPRVLDAGQCHDCYSLVVLAQKLKAALELDDGEELPVSFDIVWENRKAVALVLGLLYLGVAGIRLGPTLPAFLSPNVAKLLVDNFDVEPTGDAAVNVQ